MLLRKFAPDSGLSHFGNLMMTCPFEGILFSIFSVALNGERAPTVGLRDETDPR